MSHCLVLVFETNAKICHIHIPKSMHENTVVFENTFITIPFVNELLFLLDTFLNLVCSLTLEKMFHCLVLFFETNVLKYY